MKKGDYILIAILLLAIALMVAGTFFRTPPAMVKVTLNGDLYGEYPLNRNQKVMIQDGNKSYNILVIEDGYAMIKEADCKNQVCVNQKPISKTGESIICLPHRCVITIKGTKSSDLDAISQ